jgi:tetratricopeptide (TPR) repeat protein
MKRVESCSDCTLLQMEYILSSKKIRDSNVSWCDESALGAKMKNDKEIKLDLGLKHMRIGKRRKLAVARALAVILGYLCLTATASWGQEAMRYYQLGLKSSLAKEKVKYFSKALQLDPTLAEAYRKRGAHYFFQGKLDKAIEDFTRVIELKPCSAAAYQMRGVAYLKKGHPEGLLAELNRLALKYTDLGVPESADVLLSADGDLTRAIELNPHMVSAYAYRAEVHRLRGRTSDAIRDCSMAVRLRGDSLSVARAYATRAKLYRQAGQKELSEADYRRSVALDPFTPDYPPLHVPLMLGYSANGADLESIRWAGLLGILILSFVVVFRLSVQAPKKKD